MDIRKRLVYMIDEETGCWIWGGSLNSEGYGSISIEGKKVRAHRVSFEVFNNCKIKEDCKILHSCNVRCCINPAHLREGTDWDNAQDRKLSGASPRSRKTHCPVGHEYFGDNLYVDPTGSQRCRECKKRWR